MLLDIALDTVKDSVKVLPFLFLAYLFIEWMEKRTEEKNLAWVHAAGRWGPVLGGALGVIPQCGFSAATANLYAGGVITRGTLLAVFLSTSDEMLPILLSRNAPTAFIGKVLLFKLACGMAAGVTVDAVEQRLNRGRSKQIHDFCEQEHCHCEDGVLLPTLRHTGKIFLFLLLVSFALALAVETLGAEKLASFVLNRPVWGELLAGIIGLIPNCAASVIITELYLSGGMSAGAMASGLLVGAGVGVLVLCRMERDWKDNLLTIALLYGWGVAFGLLAELLPIF